MAAPGRHVIAKLENRLRPEVLDDDILGLCAGGRKMMLMISKRIYLLLTGMLKHTEVVSKQLFRELR